MRRSNRSLSTYVFPGAVYDLFVFAKTSFECCILIYSMSQSSNSCPMFQHSHETTRRRCPWSGVYPSLLRRPWLGLHLERHPWCSLDVWPCILGGRLPEASCHHLVVFLRMSMMLNLKSGLGLPDGVWNSRRGCATFVSKEGASNRVS